MRCHFPALLFLTLMVSHHACAQTWKGFEGYRVNDEVITGRQWNEAVIHCDQYNCRRDSLDWWHATEAKVAVFRTLQEWEKEWLIWTDLAITGIGVYSDRHDTIAEIWYTNTGEAVFIANGRADTCRIAGCDYGTYSKEGIFVGCEVFDCDNYVHLYFYRHTDDTGQCHLQPIGEYAFGEARLENLDGINALLWYRGALYWTGITRYNEHYPRTYHKLSITPNNQ